MLLFFSVSGTLLCWHVSSNKSHSLSYKPQNYLHYRFDPFTINIFFSINKTMKSKQNLVQSTTVRLFTYNLSAFFSLSNIFTDNKSLVQRKTTKVGYLDKLAPHYFHSAREHWAQVGCTTIKKNKRHYTTIPRITH